MTNSMTGFARVQAESELGNLSIELKSVNSRYLDIYFKMPDVAKSCENAMRQTVAKYITRGKLECFIRFNSATTEKLTVNEDFLENIISVSKRISRYHDIESVNVGELLKLPGVLVEKPADAEAIKKWVAELFEQALNELVKQRESEGEHLHQLISQRLTSVAEIVSEVSNNYQQSIDKIKGKLYEKLADLSERHQSQIDEVRFEQETIYLLQKMDLAEEIDRLNGHIAEVKKLLGAPVPVGRKLDFLMQEMNRESNTISSKSQSLGVTMNAVDLKVLLEQMREQIQNIE